MIDRHALATLHEDNLLCVLSTIHPDGSSQSAVVGFTSLHSGEYLIGTSEDSRKAKNLARNGAVSMVIGWDKRTTLQIEGVARVLTHDEAQQYETIVAAKNPISGKYFNEPGQVHILVSPHWLRYTDLNVHPWDIHEERLNEVSG